MSDRAAPGDPDQRSLSGSSFSRRRWWILGLWILGSWPEAHGESAGADERWKAVTSLDAGPQLMPGSSEDPRAVALAHLARQEAALRQFLASDGQDSRGFEARLRLARLLQLRGTVQGSKESISEAGRMIDSLEKSATPAQLVEVHFAQISMQMRTHSNREEDRQRLLRMARNFASQHPEDRRVAALLTEVAGLFPLQPVVMRELLERASPLAKDPDLRSRISDDLKRLDLLNKPLALRFLTLDKTPFEIGQMRGSVVAVVFFALWSQPSVNALDAVKLAVTKSDGGLRMVAISLDPQSGPVEAMLKEKALAVPVGWDGLGWEGAGVRALGINALPTVWLVDKKGRLRSLDGTESLLIQARLLLGEP